MPSISGAVRGLNSFDDLALHKSPIHRLHPLAKLTVTVVYIGFVTSFNKYDVSALLPMAFYPVIVFALSSLKLRFFIKRILIMLPFILLLGIFNPIFDNQMGWISFLSLSLKGIFTLSASLLLIATTGMNNIGLALRIIKIPKLFVLQILLTYRYITVLLNEVSRVLLAYSLKSGGRKGVSPGVWGPLCGQFLLRSFDRSQRVYDAMLLRGFKGEYVTGTSRRIRIADVIFFVLMIVLFVSIRIYNIPLILENLINR